MRIVPLDTFISRTRRISQSSKRPLVTVSYAQSIDGSITARRGYRLRLSSDASLTLSHILRTHN